jgi:putative transposase
MDMKASKFSEEQIICF